MVRFLPCRRIEEGDLIQVDQFGATYQVPELGPVWVSKSLMQVITEQHSRNSYVLVVSDLASDGSRMWVADSVFPED